MCTSAPASVCVSARVCDEACGPLAWLQHTCTRVHWEVGWRQRRAWVTPSADTVPWDLGETSPGDHGVHSPDPRCPPKESLGMHESPQRCNMVHSACDRSLGLSFPTCTVGTSAASQICHQSLCPGLGDTDSGRSAREVSHGWAPWTRLPCAPLAPPSMWTNTGL